MAGLLAGLQAPGVTVNRYCSSSLQTIRMAAHAIAAGEGDCFVAGGVETISRYGAGMADEMPNTRNSRFAEAEARSAARSGGAEGDWTPPDGLPDIYIAMGQTAENVADLKGVSRRRQDEFACLSQNRAEAARDRGFFEREITPYPLKDGRLAQNDDGIRSGTTLERLADLLPAFRPDGTVTAGNCCPLNDGAAAVVVASAERAAELGVTPLARIVSSGVSALDPEIMGLGPVGAVRQALSRAGMTIDDIDQVEINEALRRTGHRLGGRAGHRLGQAEPQRRRHRPRPSLRHDRQPHHGHAAERARGRRRLRSAWRPCAWAAARASQ